METIKFSKIAKEDIRFGRSTFEVTLADGRAAVLNEVNLDSFSDKLFSTEDATTNDITTVLTLRHTTSGTPAAGLGTRLALQAESADENPSDLTAFEGAFDDVTAGSEDSTAYILLRRAGAALSRAFGFRNTGDYNLLFSAVLTAARTITIQDATDTLVGRATTDTLTNKTLTDPTINAGTGTETLRPSGVINVDTTAASTGANLTETDLISYSLPLNTLDANGKAVRVRVWGKTAANTNTKTVRLYFGSTVVASNDQTSAPNNLNWVLDFTAIRTAAATEDVIGGGFTGTALQTTSFNATTDNTAAAITIKVTGQNGTATATDITAEGILVEFLN